MTALDKEVKHLPAMNIESACSCRFGYVSVYDPKRHMARIQFPDKDNLVSAWLPVAVPNSKKNKDENHLDVGEHVFCVMLGNGLEAGIVLCSVWDDKNTPPLGDQDVRRTEFPDGTTLSIDRKRHIVDVTDSYGCHIRMQHGNIYITAVGRIYEYAPDGIRTGVSGAGSTSRQGETRLGAEHVTETGVYRPPSDNAAEPWAGEEDW
jgi:phage baseplate assembly protein V